MTKGEQHISRILTTARLAYIPEHTYHDLRHGLFRFDFYLPSLNVLIEYQGRQHYEYVPKFYKSRIDFEQAQGRDMRKISYALAHSIPLYLIPYWDLDKLHTLSDILNDTYLARDRYANLDAYTAYQRSKH